MYKSFSSIWFRKTEFPTKAILDHIKTFQHSIFNSPKSSVVSGDRRANTFNAFPLSSALRWAPHVCLCHLCDIAYISNRWIYASMLSFESSNGGSFWPFNGWKVSFSSWVLLSLTVTYVRVLVLLVSTVFRNRKFFFHSWDGCVLARCVIWLFPSVTWIRVLLSLVVYLCFSHVDRASLLANL